MQSLCDAELSHTRPPQTSGLNPDCPVLGISIDVSRKVVLSLDIRLQHELRLTWEMEKGKEHLGLLCDACCHGNKEDVARCLDVLGCDVNGIFEKRETAVIVATAHGFANLVAFLIERGCDVHRQTPDGRTALHFAVKSNRADIVQMLLSAGSNPDMCERMGESLPLIAAGNPDGQEVLRLLLAAGADTDGRNFYLMAPLHQAAKFGSRASVEILIAAGADLDPAESWGHTPLMLAVSERREDTAEALITARAALNIQDKFSRTALHYATRRDMVPTVGLLLDYGADPDLQDSHYNTPLIEASYHNLLEVVCLLVQGNCDLEAQGQCLQVSWQRVTALRVALHRQNYTVAKVLCWAGCDIKQDILENYGRGQHPPDEAEEDFSAFLNTFLLERFRMPRTLYDLCRLSIRVHLGHRTRVKASQLPVPRTVQEDIALADIRKYVE